MTLVLYHHPFALYCWKPLIALYERDVPFSTDLIEGDRSALAALWPPASIPILVDDGLVLAESSIIVEQLDRHGDAPPLIPTDRDEALQARLWDRVADGYVATPVQRIVGDALRSSSAKDPHGVSQARATLELAYATLEDQLNRRDHHGWLAGHDFTLADCAAAPALHYADVVHPLDRDANPALAAYVDRVMTRSSVARVVGEARPYRELFPLPWPEHVS
ncbi:MAG TPA: glutathione S-transferase family protein [Solirubrobacteraceae bacterium]|jgi:glutathione S-transferase|nr:glutathione S-transferase family protein [Solirubrobacteraceae bacterium]